MRAAKLLAREIDVVLLADRPVAAGLEAQRAIVVPRHWPANSGLDRDAGVLGLEPWPARSSGAAEASKRTISGFGLPGGSQA